MDFDISTVFKNIYKGISIARAIWKMINNIKDLQQRRRELQRQINVLINILESMNTVDTLKDPRVVTELHRALGNLDLILEDIGEICATFDLDRAITALMAIKGKDKKLLERLLNKLKQAKEIASIALTVEKKVQLLAVLDQRLKLALSIVQIGFSCTQVRQIQYVEARLTAELHNLNFLSNDNLEIYTDPNGELPKAVADIKAEVKDQRLIVSWKSSGEDTVTTKFEVRYNETKYLTVTCDKSPVALGSQRITPWHDYAIQVRAVNNTGASCWSYPPVYVRMNEGAPNPPSFVIFEATTQHSLNVIAEKAPDEQAVTHMIVEKLVMGEDKVQWYQEESVVTGCCEHVLDGLDPTREYMIRVRFRNKFDVSEPSTAVVVKIENMLPNEPTMFELFPGDDELSLNPEFRFKPPSLNAGAIRKFEIELIETTLYGSAKKIIMAIDGEKEPDKDSGMVRHPIDTSVTGKLSDFVDYKMSVRAVAKNGIVEATGHLTMPSIPIDTGIDISEAIQPKPHTVMHKVKHTLKLPDDKDLHISTTFT